MLPLILLYAVTLSHAQTWNAVLTVEPYPSPYLSDWQQDPTIASLEIQNNSSKPDVVIVYLTVTGTSSNIRFTARSGRLLVNPGQPLIMTSTEFRDWRTDAIDNNLKTQAQRTGMLPEDHMYQICIEIKNLWGTSLVSNVCGWFSIIHPEPPELVFPVSNEIVASPNPVFQWIPAILAAGKQTVYVFRMVEVLAGQTPERAVTANKPHFEDFSVVTTNMEYPLSALPLEPDKLYAWQVQALDITGKPATKNNGRSGIGTFTMSPDILGAKPTLMLASPHNNAMLNTTQPVFEWVEPVIVTGEQALYTIRIAEIRRGQTPKAAIEQNIPHFVNSTTISETQFTYPASAPGLEEGKSYAWQVRALDQYGNAVTANNGKSEVRAFSVLGTGGLSVQDLVLPEKLGLPEENYAYLQLRDQKSCHVNFTFSADSTSITVISKAPLSVPLVLTVLQGNESAAPQTGATVNVTFNRYSLDITAGSINASPASGLDSPFNLNRFNVPVLLRTITYLPSNRSFAMAGPVALFGHVFSTTSAALTLTADGSLSCNIPAVNASEDISLAGAFNRLVYRVESLTGTFVTSLAAPVLPRIDISGKLVFLPGEPQWESRTHALSLSCTGPAVQIESQEISPASKAVTFAVGPARFSLSSLSCNALEYNTIEKRWEFDIVSDMALSLTDFYPAIDLPAVPSIHLTHRGFVFPQTSIPDLGIADFSSFQNVAIKPYAFRMDGRTFDWFGWDGKNTGDWGMRFDIGVKLPAMPQRLASLKEAVDRQPLSVLDAAYKSGVFTGTVEPRELAAPIIAPFTDGSGYGLNITKIYGAFKDTLGTQKISIGVTAGFILPSDSSSKAAPIAIDSGSIFMDAAGIFSGTSQSFALPSALPRGKVSIHSQASQLILGKQNNSQAAALSLDGYLEIPDVSGSIVRATGKATLDLIGSGLTAGQFTISDAFQLGLPPHADSAVFRLGCANGAVVNTQGLVFNNGSGTLYLEGGKTVGITYQNNVTFSFPELKLTSGTIAFQQPVALRIGNLDGGVSFMRWSAVAADAACATNDNNMVIGLPQTAVIENGVLAAGGSAGAAVRLNNKTYGQLRAEYASNTRIAFGSASVKQGRIDLFSGTKSVAYLDSTGFWPGDFFSGPPMNIIPLPDSAIAYISIRNASGDLLVTTEATGNNTRLFTETGKTVPVYFPGLAYGSSTIPSAQTTLDVVVNPATMALVSGTIDISPQSGNTLFPLLGAGVALDIASARYSQNNGVYGMRVNVRPVLPKALRSAQYSIQGIGLGTDGLAPVDSGFSEQYQSGAPKATAAVGDQMSVTFDGARINPALHRDSVKVSGNLLIKLFTPAAVPDPVPIHYIAVLTKDSAVFSFSKENWPGGTLPLGGCTFDPCPNGGVPLMRVSAPMNDSTFAVSFSEAVLSLKGLAGGANMTIRGLTVDQAGVRVTPPAGGQTETQSLSLWGIDLSVSSLAATSAGPQVLSLTLGGTMKVFGKSMNLQGLAIRTDCTVQDKLLHVQRVSFADSMVHVDTVAVSGGKLLVSGIFKAPKPFDTMGGQPYRIRINPSGDWVDEQGNVLATKKITAVSAELSASQVELGKQPMKVACRLAALSFSLNSSASGALGQLNTIINTYWPRPGRDSTKIVVTGATTFEEGKTTRNPWTASGSTADSVDFAGMMVFKIGAIAVLDSADFLISIGGELSLSVPGVPVSGGCAFENFVLRKDDFTFGLVRQGEMDLGSLLKITVDSLTFGKDLRNFAAYKGKFGKDEVVVDSTEDNLPIPGYYFSFGIKIASDLAGFSGGVDRFIVCKDSAFFHLYIDNANFKFSEVVEGRLDLIADIPLTTADIQFRFLIGGFIKVSGKGLAAVGEISYSETTLDKATFKCPGFGIFLAALGVDIKLTPLPITIEDIGAGIFFNPSPEVEDLVHKAIGMTNDNQNASFFDAVNEYKKRFENVMTFLEVYIYGAISVPDDAIIKGKCLLTLATDKFRIDTKIEFLGDTTMQKFIKLEAKGFMEIGVPQDFSSYPYAMGNIEITIKSQDSAIIANTFGQSVQSQKETVEKFISLPQLATGSVVFEFFVAGAEAWAIHGKTDISLFMILESSFELFIGAPGFLVRGSITKEFDAVVVKVEIGLEASVWCKWTPPREWGGYARAWVQATFISEAFAGVRGELGAAVIMDPDFYLYGYAELQAWFLDIKWTKCVWVEWKDGSIKGGSGGDSKLIEIINRSNQVADEIMGQVQQIQATINSIKQTFICQLTPEQMTNIITAIQNGQDNFYRSELNADANDVINEINRKIALENDAKWKNEYTVSRDTFIVYKNMLNEVFSSTNVTSLSQTLSNWTSAVNNLNNTLSAKVAQYDSMFNALSDAITKAKIELDTLVAFSDPASLRLADPLSVSSITDAQSGKTIPTFTIDNSIVNKNKSNVQTLEQEFDTWLVHLKTKVSAIDSMRIKLYAIIGPGGAISGTQNAFASSLISQETISRQLLKTAGVTSSYYLMKHWNLQERWGYRIGNNVNTLTSIFTFARWQNDALMKTMFDRRLNALQKLAGSEIPVDFSVYNQAVAADILGLGFYHDVPVAYCKFVSDKLDSLYLKMVPVFLANTAQKDEVHRKFTWHTDELWDRYAQVSENLYEVYDTYLDDLKLGRKASRPLPETVEAVSQRRTRLKNEFLSTGSGSFSATLASDTSAFLPTTVNLSWSNPGNLVEFAYNINRVSLSDPDDVLSGQWQSVGNKNQFSLDLFDDPAVKLVQKVQIGTRVRNKAGYPIEGLGIGVSLRNHNGATGLEESTMNTYHSTNYACITNITFPGLASGKFGNETYYHTNSQNQVKVRWQISEWGGKLSPFANMQYALFSSGQAQPVKDWTSAGTLTSADITGLTLSANTGNYYYVKIRGVAVDGTIQNEASSPPLYIDKTPPVWTSNSTVTASKDTYHYENRTIITVACKAFEIYDKGNPSNALEYIDTLSNYQCKLYRAGDDTSTISWQEIPPAIEYYGKEYYYTSTGLHLDAGTFFMKTAGFVALRAKNSIKHSYNGWSEPLVAQIPRQYDMTPPSNPSFSLIGMRSNDSILITITKPSEDKESGVAGYQYSISLASNGTVLRPYPADSTKYDFSGDTVKAGTVLILRLGQQSISLGNAALDISLRALNYSGEWMAMPQRFCIPPPVCRLKASIVPNSAGLILPPFLLNYQFGTDGQKYPYSHFAEIYIGTSPGSQEIMKLPAYLLCAAHGFEKNITSSLPNSVTYGQTIYITARNSMYSSSCQTTYAEHDSMVSVRTPDAPIFENVETDNSGNIVIPIVQAAFGGNTSAKHQYEVQSKTTGELFRAFPSSSSQEDFPANTIVPGAKLTLPFKMPDLSPQTTIRIRGIAADGSIDCDSVTFRPVPPPPVITWTRIRQIDDQYILELKWENSGCRVMRESSLGGVTIRVCGDTLQAQKTALYFLNANYLGSASIGIPKSAGSQPRIWCLIQNNNDFCTWSPTVTVPIDMPSQAVVDNAAYNQNGNIAAHIGTTGMYSSMTPAGYQWALSINTTPRTMLRDFPSDNNAYDFSASAAAVGSWVELPFDVSAMPYRSVCIISFKATATTGERYESEYAFTSLPPAPLNASLSKEGATALLQVWGIFKELYRFGGNLPVNIKLGTTDGGSDMFQGQFAITSEKGFSQQFTCAKNISVGVPYYLTSWYALSSGDTSAVSKLMLTLSGEPMFDTVGQAGDSLLIIPVVKEGFNGANITAGYQYALGSDSTSFTIRPFPAVTTQFDFSKNQVSAGSEITMPITSYGMPYRTFVALRAISTGGVKDVCVRQALLNPTRPEIELIGVRRGADNEQNHYLQFRVKRSSLDSKAGHLIMRFWYGDRNDKTTMIRQGYFYPTWDWSYYHNSTSPDPVYECPMDKYFVSGWPLWVELRAQDSYRMKTGEGCVVRFNVNNASLTITNIQRVE